jgi:hypothetical protein
MRHRLLAFIAIFFLVVATCLLVTNVYPTQAQKPAGDAPGQVDKSGVSERPMPQPQDFPDTELGARLTQHLNLLTGVGEDAERKYQASLRTLQQQAPEAAKLLFSSYLKMDESRYFRRWAIVETLKELHSNEAFAYLQRIALTPLPKERFSDPETSSIDKESHIRVTGVDGIAELAKLGNKNAENALTQFFTYPDLTVRRRAIRGYLAAGTGNRSEYARKVALLKSKLPRSDQSLITLDVTNIKRVPYPDDIPDKLTAPQKKRDDAPPEVKR